ncbi:hypothetical protein GCM10022280_06940 [Sphingomonas swuensis]|uniref:Uncharacterized protein n=1 Tax=Sphingomonas swuensis TaxID=977800 RepID=A0ABP7SHW1_9SPHN
MSTLQFYAERAAECRKDAEAATLDNVRNRNLEAASAWEAMAERMVRTNAHREANEASRAAREG